MQTEFTWQKQSNILLKIRTYAIGINMDGPIIHFR